MGVIASSPTDIQPVLDTIAESAARLCDADDAAIRRVDGDVLRLVAHYGDDSESCRECRATARLAARSAVGRSSIAERIHIHDLDADR